MKISNDTIRNRTRDIPACSAAPQPTAPPAACLSLHAECLLTLHSIRILQLFPLDSNYFIFESREHTHTHTHTHTQVHRLRSPSGLGAKSCTVVPTVCGCSVWNLLHVVLWRLEFGSGSYIFLICTPLCAHARTHTHTHTYIYI